MGHLVGRIDFGRPGPTLIVVGGVHGSEPAGVEAGARVLERVSTLGAEPSGGLVVLRGNTAALDAGCRYIDEDLNRIWRPERIEAVLERDEREEIAEHGHMRGLAEALKECFDTAAGPVFFLDLHTTSSETIPFFWLVPGGETEVINHYGMPIVFDPMLKIEGTLGQWVAAQGHRVLLAEAGQHEDPSAVDHCEAIIWITLVQAGLAAERGLRPEYERSRALLHGVCDTRSFFNIVHHHRVEDGDGFTMRPGYRSFQPIRKGELLAHDSNGEIRAPCDGRILMPLYEPPCDDGFLIVKEDTRPPHF